MSDKTINPTHPDTAPPKPRPRSKRRLWLLWAYLGLLAASHIVQELRPDRYSGNDQVMLRAELPTLTRSGTPERMVYREWPAQVRANAAVVDRPPIILIHGSPGRGEDFHLLAPLIADAGYRVIAVDLPGFGDSSHDIADHSILAHAHRVLAMMDVLGIPRAHVLGWSNGGGVALHMADLAPDRIATLTMLASIGDQAREGSGSYEFEHVKYALGLAAVGGIPTLIPHFGLLGDFTQRTDFLLNFWDSDQRPLKAIMERLKVPTLIIHGRQDMLIRADTAEEHHRLINTSSLVMLHANHFLPFLQAPEVASYLVPFLTRHDTPGVRAMTTSTDLSPVKTHKGFGAVMNEGRTLVHALPWWAQISLIGKIVLVAPTIGIVACALFVVTLDVDFLVAIAGIALGLVYQTGLLLLLGAILGKRLYRVPWLGKRIESVSDVDWKRRMATRPASEGWVTMFIARARTSSLLGAVLCRPPIGALALFVLARLPAILVWAAVSFFVALAGMIALHLAWPLVGPTRLLLAGGLVAIVVRAAPMLLVTRGRQWVQAWWERAVHYEYWPAWIFYIPLVPYIAWLSFRHKGLTVLTCCNPGIANGGGLIGESKSDIMSRLGDSSQRVPTILIPADPTAAERAALVRDAMKREPGIASFPLVIKPDAGQRGFAVRIIRSDDQLLPYFQMMTTPAIIQPYHPGPQECGVLWARHTPPSNNGHTGFIYSITRKDFPELVGDGYSSVEELIYSHPRHRRQMDVFLDRFPDLASRVLADGEVQLLGMAGNHCQGALFRDGADLITPQVSATIDRLASGFKGGLDFGRFDLRYTDEAALQRGDFGIVELNGTSSESTNLYDPNKSIFWAYRVLFGQWRLLFELGEFRRRQGVKPMSLWTLLRSVRGHYTTRRGSALAD